MRDRAPAPAAVDRKGTSGDSRRWSGEMARQRRGRRVEWLGHYSSAQTILVVGDGDLSFSLALAAAFGSGNNLVATSLDSYDALTSKYGKAESNVTTLKMLGATVLHGVDAKMMKHHPCLKMRRFDRIVFNFPHVGFIGREKQDHMINAHQLLMRRFFRNASHLLHPHGDIHVSHKTGQPYDRWEIEELASEFSLVMFEMVAFRKEDYPGYNQKRGDGERCDEEFPLHNGCTSKFRIEREEAEESARKDAISIEHLAPYMASQSSVKNNKAPVMLCACGSAAARRISSSERNPGRRYMRCKHARPISNSERNVGRTSSAESYPEDCYLWIWEDLLSKYVEDMVQYSTIAQRESLHRLQESLDVVTNLHQEKEQQLLLLQQELIFISESLRSCEHARSTLEGRLEEEQRRSSKFTAAQRESDAATSAIQTAHITRAKNAKNKFVQTEKRELGLGGKDGTSLLKAVFSLYTGVSSLSKGP